MAKIIDRLLLFVYCLVVLLCGGYLLVSAFNLIPYTTSNAFLYDVYMDTNTAIAVITVTIVVMLISIRFLYISLRTGRGSAPSIDQRTEFGDIRISLETVENLALKAASRVKGARDLRARVRVTSSGLDIVIRSVVDGEAPIPVLTEDMQRLVKDQIEEITGIPVSDVSVFVANIASSSPTFKSRVE